MDGIDYAEISHNAKCLAELLVPDGAIVNRIQSFSTQDPQIILNLIIPGYIQEVKKRLRELQQKSGDQHRSR